MDKIKFDRWWKKLNTPEGFVFTTLRRYTQPKLSYYKSKLGNVFDVVVTDTRNGFKGFSKTDYIILIFEVIEKFVRGGKLNIRAKLVYVDIRNYEDLSKEFIEYDTREDTSIPPAPKREAGIREEIL